MRVRFCMNAGPKNNKVWADKKGRGSECAGATWISNKETLFNAFDEDAWHL